MNAARAERRCHQIRAAFCPRAEEPFMAKRGCRPLQFALAFCLGLAALCSFGPRARAAPHPLDAALEQTRRIQQLAGEYAAQPEGAAEPLMLTVNYIRAQRYTGFTWDMILGRADEGFAAWVGERAPELAALQSVRNVALPSGEEVDFVHLVAGAGATYKRVPAVCTWGGDCIQLAGSIQGAGPDEAACMKLLAPYFAAADENASLLPRSDWLADLDGVNIGGGLAAGSDLAGAIETYYASITDAGRARQFVASQFGAADTGDTEAFRALVKSAFFQDPGIQLFLMSEEYLTLDSDKNPAPVESMRAPLNAACSLLADELAAMLGGAQVDAPPPESRPPLTAPSGTEGPASSQAGAPEGAGTAPSQPLRPLWLLAGAAAICILLVLLFAARRR